MSKVKRTISLLLSAVMATSLLLTGCSGGKDPSSSSSPKGESPSPEATVKEEALKPVKLIWYIRKNEPKNKDSVMAKVNEYLTAKINATLDLRFINDGDYDNKMSLIMSSGEEYDIAFTSSWTNNFLNNVGKGAYIPLDDLVANFPDLQKLFRKEIWDSTRVNGKIYAVPNNQIMADQSGMWFNKSLLDKHNIDAKQIKSMEDLQAAFQTIKDKEPDVIPTLGGNPVIFSPPSGRTEIWEGFWVDTKTWQVGYGSDMNLERYKLMREWNQKGFFPQDVATLKDFGSLIKSAKAFSGYSRPKPGIEAEFKVANGIDIVQIETGPASIRRNSVLTTLTAISTTSKNPERAMMLIDLVNKDKELFNLLKFGIEGQDYTKISENRIEKKPDTYSAHGFMLGNEFNSFLIAGDPDDRWEQTKKINDSAVVDPLISFSFDRSKVESEAARLSAVDKEFATILNNGLDDPEKIYKAKMDKRKAAGQDKVLEELQRQIDEWRKTQP